jgi:hypothetical protein
VKHIQQAPATQFVPGGNGRSVSGVRDHVRTLCENAAARARRTTFQQYATMRPPVLFATVAAVLLGVVVGFVRGGSLGRLAHLNVRLAWLAGVAWMVQVVLFASPLADGLAQWAPAIHLASIGLVGVVIVANRAVPGAALFAVGLMMNAAVIGANGGFMPVSEAALEAAGNGASSGALERGEHIQKAVLMRPDSPLWVLGDVFPFRPIGKVYSVGDVVAAIGALLLVSQGMGTRHAPEESYQVQDSLQALDRHRHRRL